MTKLTESEMVDLVVGLAKEVEATDSIDWGMFPAGEDNIYRLVATQILESLQYLESNDDRLMVLLATTVKLTVENTVLYQQKMKKLQIS